MQYKITMFILKKPYLQRMAIQCEKTADFKWKHYQPEIILLTVRWYLRYVLSYNDGAERGFSISHTTIMR